MNFKTLLLFPLLMQGLNALSQTEGYSDTISRSFPSSKGVNLNISNKYGAVSIATWDKDSVNITIEMMIKAKDDQKLEKLKNSIDFEFLTGQYFITANTLIDDGGADIIKDLVDIAGNYFSSSNSVTINYAVTLPAGLPVKIENRFGDVYTGDMSSDIKLSLFYGDLKAGNLSGICDISISAGNAEIENYHEGQVSVSFSSLRIKEAGKINLISRSSTINIDQVRELKTDSRRDKVFIGGLSEATGSGYFTDFDITTIDNAANLSLRYGRIHIDSVKQGFSLLSLSSEYTDMNLGFSGSPDFHFDLTQDREVTFIYPKKYATLEQAVVNEESGTVNHTGFFGQGNESSSVVIIADRRCELVISLK